MPPVAASGPVVEERRSSVPPRERARPALIQTVRSIVVTGLPDGVRSDLLSRLPVQEGSRIAPGTLEKIAAAAREVDEHLTVSIRQAAPDAVELVIAAPPQRIRVGGNVQQARLISQPKPMYPPEAKQERIQGVVKLSAVLGKDGTVQQLELLGGHPLLVQSAMEAVKHWVYQPTLLNGTPVEVVTRIDVNYTLSQ